MNNESSTEYGNRVPQTQRNATLTVQRVLIVEDEPRLLSHLMRIFSESGFSVFSCATIQELEGLVDLQARRFDLILLDRMLQNRDSAEILPGIKKQFPSGKVIILSAINSAAERAALLDRGADDYMGKPFDSTELIARARALLRRGPAQIQFGNLALDSVSRTINVGNAEMPLTNKEFLLLRALIQTPGKIFSKAYLYDEVWGIRADVESNVVETTVNKLRRRLRDAGATVTIKNSRNIGYWVEE